jgi:hypothetical protein
MPKGIYNHKSLSKEHKQKIKTSLIGRIPWNKGKSMSDEFRERISLIVKGRKHTKETKERISKSHKGMSKPWAKFNSTFKKGFIPYNKGKKANKEWRDKLSQSLKRYFDKIGRADIKRYHHINDRIYLQWRMGVFERDKYTCQKCGKRGGELNAHHIKSWSKYPKLRYEIANGKTFCVICHKNI